MLKFTNSSTILAVTPCYLTYMTSVRIQPKNWSKLSAAYSLYLILIPHLSLQHEGIAQPLTKITMCTKQPGPNMHMYNILSIHLISVLHCS